jgi:hypothetical protein
MATVPARGVPQDGQNRAPGRTGFPQRGQVEGGAESAEAPVTGWPHRRQKRAPGRRGSPQLGHAAAGRGARQALQKRAPGRLTVPHRGQMFMVAYRLSRIAYRVSHIAYRISRIANRESHIAYRISHIAHRTPHIARRLSLRGSADRLQPLLCRPSHGAVGQANLPPGVIVGLARAAYDNQSGP